MRSIIAWVTVLGCSLSLGCSSQSTKVIGSGGQAGAGAGGTQSGGSGGATGGSAGTGAGGSAGSGTGGAAGTGTGGAAGGGGAAGATGCDCMPSADSSWIPAAIAKGAGVACPAGYDGTTFEGGATPKDTGCACSCGAVTGATCAAVLEIWNNQTNCTGLGPTETPFTNECYSGTLKKSAKLQNKVTTPGSCSPSAKLNPPAFENPWTVCSVSSLTNCATGVCSPAAGTPFQNQCIISTGPKACPSGYTKAFEFYTQLDDKRSCGAGCTCAPPKTTCSGAQANRCDTNGSCPTSCPTPIPVNTCTNVDGKAIRRLADGTPSGSCNATGSAAVNGSVSVTGAPQIVCCLGPVQ